MPGSFSIKPTNAFIKGMSMAGNGPPSTTSNSLTPLPFSSSAQPNRTILPPPTTFPKPESKANQAGHSIRPPTAGSVMDVY